MKKSVIYTEVAYVLGLLILAVGTALTEYGDLGISMVVAPAYLVHLKLGISFGTAEYLLQALILLVMMLVLRKVRLSYLFSFVTAILYGLFLDGTMLFTALLPENDLALRIVLYILGVLIGSAAISLLFSTYFPPAAYEMFVKQIAIKFHKPISVVKTVYDCSSLVVSVGLSFLFFGQLRGIGVATVICAFVNGWLIKLFTDFFSKRFQFKDKFPLRQRFEESEDSL